MTTRLELAYLLRKHFPEDPFETELPVQIPIQGQIRLLNEAGMEAAATQASTIMGVRMEGPDDQQVPKFVRHSPVPGLPFPEISEQNARFSKLRFRILSSGQNLGQEINYVITYEVDNNDCRVVGGNTLLGNNWIALVTLDQGSFQFLYRRQGGGPGGGDPCDVWDCANTENWAIKIKCVLNGCAI